jgi:hypothetical protein
MVTFSGSSEAAASGASAAAAAMARQSMRKSGMQQMMVRFLKGKGVIEKETDWC